MLDDDLNEMTRERLVEEVQKLREGIRKHRDEQGMSYADFIRIYGIYCRKNMTQPYQYRNGRSLWKVACDLENLWMSNALMRLGIGMNSIRNDRCA